MKRLLFALLLLATACASTAPEPPPLKVLTYNIHYWVPVTPKPEGKAAFRAAAAGDVVGLFVQALAPLELDILGLQEARDPDKVADLATRLGMQHVFFPGGWKSKGWPRGIPGAILVRGEILESADCPLVGHDARPKDLFTRHFGRALVRTARGEVAVYSVHLLPSWKNTEHIRLAEIAEIEKAIAADRAKGRSIVVLGDCNFDATTEEYRAMAKTGLTDAFGARGAGPAMTCPTATPKERIDYLWIDGPLTARLHATRVLTEAPFGLHEDNSAGYALSDHLPVLAEFR